MKTTNVILVAMESMILCAASPAAESVAPSPYEVVWDSPSADYNGTMPLGNGEIALNAWIEPSGDLRFYIARTDAWDDSGRLVKVGAMRIKVGDGPAERTKKFRQILTAKDGTLSARYGEGDDQVELRLWVDANRPVICVEAKTVRPSTATAMMELWRNVTTELPDKTHSDVLNCALFPEKTVVEPDTVISGLKERIGWYHRNIKSVGPANLAKMQGVEEFPRAEPLLHRTFGAVIAASRAKRMDDRTLQSTVGTSHLFEIAVLTKHPATVEEWLVEAQATLDAARKLDLTTRRAAHEKWWAGFWNRSWIHVTKNSEKADEATAVVSRAYALQRYMAACAGRGKYPIKFNGSLFTVPFAGKKLEDADFRQWGPGYWWQNTRLPYFSMCAAGDFEMMEPLFNMYARDLLPFLKFRTKKYLGHGGAYIPECIYFWGDVFAADYGNAPFATRADKLQASEWHKYEWVSGLELVTLLLDRYAYNEDATFLRETVIPAARELLGFFDQHYKTNGVGKLDMQPSQALETWVGCVNPMPELAGLHSTTARLLALPEKLTRSEDRAFFKQLQAKLPPLPSTKTPDGKVMLAPAEVYKRKQNSEVPELYAVFPFRQIAVGKPNLDWGLEALNRRMDKGASGWRQDDVFMAFLGEATQARDNVVQRARSKHGESQFPTFWGPNFDWVPDQDHGSVLLIALQSMLLQADGRKIYLLPAWPRDWDCEFKLHAPYNTTVEGVFKAGKLEKLTVTPKSRARDVIVMIETNENRSLTLRGSSVEYQGDKLPATKPASKSVRPTNPGVDRWPPADQVFDKNSLPDPADKDEADAVLRRTGALLAHLKTLPHCPNLKQAEKRLSELKARSGLLEGGGPERDDLLDEACKLRRKVAFANPLLDFDKILFIKRHFCPKDETSGNHMCDQNFGFNAIRGGGLFVLENPFSDAPTVRNVLDKSVCENGRYKGRVLSGKDGFLSPELSFDAKEVLFACTEIPDDQRRYQNQHYTNNTYKIFCVNLDGSGLTQLTDGEWNDFDPCYLPSGRNMFISERRGGFGRCHGRPVPSFTLHSMNWDGSDIVELSPHETNEWQPSVDNNGLVIYTRWDYVDRGFNQAHHAWTTTPDGRDPRAIHGNFSPNQGSRPHLEISMRAVPNSRKYMGTAACHHGQAYGSIILIDPSVPDDNAMAPVKRLTPDQLFPEAEIGVHGPPVKYAAPYPLSEYYFLCVYDKDSRSDAGTSNNYGIYLVDAFGNKELLYRDDAISCLDPIPIRPRPVPHVISHMTAVGKPLKPGKKFVPPDPKSIPDFGTVGLVNVYDSIYSMTNQPKITSLRVIQLLPKTTPLANQPFIGFGDQKSARLVLGTVPVEDDGSAFFKMPVNRPVYFQALDADGMAVQSMRSATYVHPGEILTCIGCHNSRNIGYKASNARPAAFKRQVSELKPDVEGSRPFSYPILVQPVLEKNCVECHKKSRAEGKKAPDLTRTPGENNRWFTSYDSLRSFAFFWNNAVFDNVPDSKPGEIGARRSRLYQMLTKGHHDLKLSKDDMHRLTLWLDCNSDFYGSYEKLEEQKEGKVVWPSLE